MIPEVLRNPLGTGLGGTFFIYGSDEYRKDEVVRALVDAHLDPGTRDFNLDVLRGGELDRERLASVASTPPMMASFRVVVVREVEALASSPKARDLLLELADTSEEGLALVLVATVPRRSKARFYRDLAANTRSLELDRLSEDDLPGWLMDRARKVHDVELEEAAARALTVALGTDLDRVTRELEKLATLAGEGGTVSLETVERAGTRLPRQDRWEWFDLVGKRRFSEALDGLPVLLQHGETGVGLTIGLTTHLLRVGVVVEAGERALSAVLPGNQRWLASRYRQQARDWSGPGLVGAIRGLREVDRRLKSSPLSDRHHLEVWLLERMAEGAG